MQNDCLYPSETFICMGIGIPIDFIVNDKWLRAKSEQN